MSTCQQQYINYAKDPLPGQMIPRCKKDGSFEPVQCQNLECFCVDEDGNQINGTSLPVRLGKPKCDLSGTFQSSFKRFTLYEALLSVSLGNVRTHIA